MALVYLWYLFLIGATVFAIYCIYKVIWYIVKICMLNAKISSFEKKGAVVTRLRSSLGIIFGQKGKPDFIIIYNGKKYEISVVSFISNHSRYNIEKTPTKYILEVRKYANIFYNTYHNSGTEPTLSKEYRREISLYRKELFLSNVSKEYEKQILLFYPSPKTITMSDTRWEYVYYGEKISGHEVMSQKEFFELF